VSPNAGEEDRLFLWISPKTLLRFTAAAGIPVLVLPVLLSLRYGGLLEALGTNPMLAFALAGASAIHFSRRPAAGECAATAGLAAALRFAYTFGYPASLVGWGSFFGLASIVVLGLDAARTRGRERRSAASDVMAGGMFLYYWIVLGFVLLITDYLIPRTCDQFLYAFDGSLGFQPSFVLGRFARAHPAVRSVLATVYEAVALPVAILWAIQRRRRYTGGYKILPLLIAASTGGYLLYYVFPATGPVYEFRGTFPLGNPPVSLEVGPVLPLIERAVRNGMPSLHFGTALLILWNARILSRPARAALWLFLAGTAIATLALGQHYLIDLVVAVPVMLAFHAGAMNSLPLTSGARRTAIAAGMALTAGWLVFLRFGVTLCLGRPAVGWTMIVFTVAACVLLEARLRAAAAQPANRCQSAR
jgi:hypothetical protein